MFCIFGRITSVRQIEQIFKTYVLWRNKKNKTRPFLHINLLIKYSVQQQILLMANSLRANAVIVMRVHCNSFLQKMFEPMKFHCTFDPCHYENTPIQIYWKFRYQKMKFSDKKKKSDFFHISAQNIDCGYSLEPPRWGGSNEYPQSMFWAEIRKTMYTPCKPQFYYIKVGFKGVKSI